jgi:hypothetical protein
MVATDGVVEKPWGPFGRHNPSRQLIPFSGGGTIAHGSCCGEVLQTVESKTNLSLRLDQSLAEFTGNQMTLGTPPRFGR